MSDKPVTLIVSDLHVGGGRLDPGDDHVYQGDQLARFLREQAEHGGGMLELIFNGDFLEFAQVNQRAFSHVDDAYWCTEDESLAKLETIIAGHPGIFDGLQRLQAAGNLVTIAAGNHDVDLYWPRVQQRLREVAGQATQFATGAVWIERYGGKLQIGHGHMDDPANRFDHWDDPVRTLDFGVRRLEMCPGTLFMVKFVNRLEAKYPFADNLLPVGKLATVLMRDDKSGLFGVGWALATFAGGSPLSALGTGGGDDYGAWLVEQARTEPAFRDSVASALADAGLPASVQRWTTGPVDAHLMAQTMFDLLGRIDDGRWKALFERRDGKATLSAGDDVTLSAVARAAFEDGKKQLRIAARDRADATGASVVVMGHTHQRDKMALDGGGLYLNPGCWTRYLELKPGQRVTLEDLKDESRYPYELNVVRVDASAGALHATIETIDAHPGRP